MTVTAPGVHACTGCGSKRSVRPYAGIYSEEELQLCGPCRYYFVARVNEREVMEIKDVRKQTHPEVVADHQEYCGDCGLPLTGGREECFECGSLVLQE